METGCIRYQGNRNQLFHKGLRGGGIFSFYSGSVWQTEIYGVTSVFLLQSNYRLNHKNELLFVPNYVS